MTADDEQDLAIERSETVRAARTSARHRKPTTISRLHWGSSANPVHSVMVGDSKRTNTARTTSPNAPTQIASFGRRFGAYLIDVGIIFGGVGLIAAITETGGSFVGLSLAVYAWMLLYKPASALLFGITPGKAMLGLCLVTDDNVPVMADRGKALGREIMWTIFAVIPICNLVWAAMTLADSKKQGWHDNIAGTLVVRKP